MGITKIPEFHGTRYLARNRFKYGSLTFEVTSVFFRARMIVFRVEAELKKWYLAPWVSEFWFLNLVVKNNIKLRETIWVIDYFNYNVTMSQIIIINNQKWKISRNKITSREPANTQEKITE